MFSNLFLTLTLTFATLSWSASFDQLFNDALAIHKTKPEKAIEFFKQALLCNPESVETQYNLAYVLKNSARAQEALPYYDAVLAQQPSNGGAHIGKAQACLLQGEYLTGWQELEWRLGAPCSYTQELVAYTARNQSLANKKILIHAEWGMGDTIMLLRYAQLLHEQGAYVMIHLLHEALVPLCKLQPYLDEVIGPKQEAPPAHFHIPMMSLPILFKTTVDTIPYSTPYLETDRIPKSRYTLNKQTFNVGICWHGNTIHGEEKFMPLHYFSALAGSGITLYSLQQHHGLDQLRTVDAHTITTFDTAFDQIPFFDTIRLMQQLDLIITVDTAIAHLAGALHIPVWVILPRYADWRWIGALQEYENTTPWYSTMRLFRQKAPGDWQSVVQAIQDSLALLIL